MSEDNGHEPPSNIARLAELSAVRRPPFDLLDYETLMTLPDPSWMINGLLPDAPLAVMFGPSGSFKSFLALDLAMSVAAGVDWHGHGVERPGWVVYVAAEGHAGLAARARAWRYSRGQASVTRMRWLAEAINLRDGDVQRRLRDTLDGLPETPRLLVVDTMARSIPGGDENSAKDVGEFIAGLGEQPANTTLVVHHTGHAGGHERGSSALAGAADVRLKVGRRGPYVELSCEKMKDAAEWPMITLALEPTQTGSCVLAIVESSDAQVRQREDLAERVFEFVTAHEPVSQNAVEKGVEGRREAIREALRAHEDIIATGDGLRVRPDGRGAPGAHPSGDTPGGSAPEAGETPKGSPLGAHPSESVTAPAPQAPGAPSEHDLLMVDESGGDAAVDALLDAFDAVELDVDEPLDADVLDFRAEPDRWVSSADAVVMTGMTSVALVKVARSTGLTDAGYRKARVAAGWRMDTERPDGSVWRGETGWGPGRHFRLADLRELAPDAEAPPRPTDAELLGPEPAALAAQLREGYPNLTAACSACNHAKWAHPLLSWLVRRRAATA